MHVRRGIAHLNDIWPATTSYGCTKERSDLYVVVGHRVPDYLEMLRMSRWAIPNFNLRKNSSVSRRLPG